MPEALDSIRYYFALLIILTVPPALPFWIMLHPFVDFWRRLGLFWTYLIQAVLFLAMATAIFLFRESLLRVDFGTSYFLIITGVAFVAVSIKIAIQRKKQLTNKILFGAPELKQDKEAQGELLTEGIYAKIRHPRYVEIVLGLIGYALIANFLAIYLTVVFTVFILWVIILLEEAELRKRFGKAYDAYAFSVPRFIPRRR